MDQFQDRIQRLTAYVRGLMLEQDGGELYREYQPEISTVQPQEAFRVFHGLLQDGVTPGDILIFLDKVINVFYEGLSAHQWQMPESREMLQELMMENEALERKMEAMKTALREPDFRLKKQKLLPLVQDLLLFEAHYLKKENILFPYLEKAMPHFQGVSIMWALHDQVRQQIKQMVHLLKDPEVKERTLNQALGELFFSILFLVKKEELILFPSASEVLSEKEWQAMENQRFEYEAPFISRPDRKHITEKASDPELEASADGDCRYRDETGELNLDEIQMIFNALPVDITFVDASNKVRYFSRPKDRIFPRSPAIIGRDVKNCHPPDSVHVVEEIVESFRAGRQNTASFWIQVQDRFLLIQYVALRDGTGDYRGTLEISQDITEHRQLEGERRLLQWNDDRVKEKST